MVLYVSGNEEKEILLDALSHLYHSEPYNTARAEKILKLYARAVDCICKQDQPKEKAPGETAED